MTGPDTTGRAGRRRRPVLLACGFVAALVVATLVVLAAGPPAPAPPVPPVAGPPPVPDSPTGLYVDPDSPAARQAREWQAAGRAEDARRMGVLAAQPVPEWATDPTGQVGAQVAGYVGRAVAAGRQPFLVAYHIPDRDCAGFSAGGATDAADYHAWVRELAGALGGHAATVVLEPDAVPHELSGCAGGRATERYALLTDAVRVLKASGPVRVYLDAGNPGFVTDVDALAGALRSSGITHADGFSLNVANFYPTPDVLAYGERLSDALGGAHFVVDTSRNGNGRVDGDEIDGGPAFCNPPGRAVGRAPTAETGDRIVDAYLWVKRVGESDGACRPGEPPAGQWWPAYALSLVPAG